MLLRRPLRTTSQTSAAAGELTQEVSNDGTADSSYDTTGQLTGVSGWRTESYAYDDLGNRTTSGYQTGTGNRLVSDGTFNYTYDPFDRRIGTSVDPDGDGPEVAEETWTVYDGANLYADFDGSGSLTYRYLYGPAVDMILARMDASDDVAWYLTDHLGSVRDIADLTGTVIDHVQYDSFGNLLSETNPTAGDRFKFTGREYDEATGQYYYRARYYDAAVGRFLSEDPLRFQAGDPSLFCYVGNSPTNSTDPSGQVQLDPSDPHWAYLDYMGDPTPSSIGCFALEFPPNPILKPI